MRVDDFLKTNGSGGQEEIIPTGDTSKEKVLWSYTILDTSGSMADRQPSYVDGKYMYGPSKFEVAVEGIKSDIKSMKEDTTGVKLVVGIVEFSGDSRQTTSYYNYKAKNVNPSAINYVPGRPGGGTPLVATLGDVITEICMVKPSHQPCIITVFTDGEDNTSQSSKWSQGTALRDLMEDALRVHNVSVKFIGTEADVDKMVNAYGIKVGDTFKYDGTSRGLERSFNVTQSARVAYTKGYAGGASVEGLNSMDFFSDPNVNTPTENSTPLVSPSTPKDNQAKDQKKARSTKKDNKQKP